VAADTLTPRLRQHSYRTYRFGRALGELEGLQVDAELLFAAAILHDSGPVNRPTALSSRCRRCGSRARSPARWGCPPRPPRSWRQRSRCTTARADDGGRHRGVPARGGCGRGRGRRPELGPAPPDAAQRGAGLPTSRVQDGVRGRVPRRSGRVPQGRAKFVNRYGALLTAIKLAPFDERGAHALTAPPSADGDRRMHPPR
jgi:hypothetical protein